MPVLQGHGLAIEAELKTSVAQFAVVGPIVVDTADGVLETLQSQQVLRVVDIIVDIHAQAVVQEVGLQADIELMSSLPLDFLVAHIGQLDTDFSIVVANRRE